MGKRSSSSGPSDSQHTDPDRGKQRVKQRAQLSLREQFKAIIAIVAVDFGTSETGVGYIQKGGDDGQVKIISPEFPRKSKELATKVPTVILLEKNAPHKLIAFGKQASEMWLKDDDRESKLLFRSYKLSLQCEEGSDGELFCTPVGSAEHATRVKASLVMQRTFEAIKTVVVRQIKTGVDHIDESKILWVISKPCQWFDVTTVSICF